MANSANSIISAKANYLGGCIDECRRISKIRLQLQSVKFCSYFRGHQRVVYPNTRLINNKLLTDGSFNSPITQTK